MITDYTSQVQNFFGNVNTKMEESSVCLLLASYLASSHSPRFCLDIVSKSENVNDLTTISKCWTFSVAIS